MNEALQWGQHVVDKGPALDLRPGSFTSTQTSSDSVGLG